MKNGNMKNKTEWFKPIGGNFNKVCRDCVKKSPSSSVAWFLMTSFAYYHYDISILTDEVFDKMCKYMLDNYELISHPHKYLVTKDMLGAGSGYNLTWSDYPQIVRVSTHRFINEIQDYNQEQYTKEYL